MATKRVSRQKREERLQLVSNDNIARIEGPQRRKTFNLQDMHNFDPLTENQARAFEFIDEQADCGVVLHGYPGTGKSFIAIYRALQLVLSKQTCFKKILIVRSTVQSRDMGFLPGEDKEKIAPFEEPYIGIFDTIFKFKKSYENLKEAGIVEFASTAFLRGTTYDDTIIIFDEFQNTKYQEATTVISRVGNRSKVILCGDVNQNDLKDQEKSDCKKFLDLMYKIQSNDFIQFDVQDIVRSGYVKDVIMAQIALKHI